MTIRFFAGTFTLLMMAFFTQAHAADSLAGTKWVMTYSFNDGSTGDFTYTFKDDGTATNLAPNGQVSTVYYSENAGGRFVIQSPNSTTNPNIISVVAGEYQNGVGLGQWINYNGDGNKTQMLPITMLMK